VRPSAAGQPYAACQSTDHTQSTQYTVRSQSSAPPTEKYNQYSTRTVCLQCFGAAGWAAGRASGPVKKLSGGVLTWLSVSSEVQTCIWPSGFHCHSLYLASVKSRLVIHFWYRLTWVVPDNRPLNGCVCVYSMRNVRRRQAGHRMPGNIYRRTYGRVCLSLTQRRQKDHPTAWLA